MSHWNRWALRSSMTCRRWACDMWATECQRTRLRHSPIPQCISVHLSATLTLILAGVQLATVAEVNACVDVIREATVPWPMTFDTVTGSRWSKDRSEVWSNEEHLIGWDNWNILYIIGVWFLICYCTSLRSCGILDFLERSLRSTQIHNYIHIIIYITRLPRDL